MVADNRQAGRLDTLTTQGFYSGHVLAQRIWQILPVASLPSPGTGRGGNVRISIPSWFLSTTVLALR